MTPVEWFHNELKNLIRESELTDLKPSEFDKRVLEIINQAKEMEENIATEYAEFCIRCDRANLKQVKFEDWKKSWDERFKRIR